MTVNARLKYVKIVLGESAVASSAATFVMMLELPVWAMFVGWIAFFTRGLNLRSGLISLACVLTGMVLGLGAAYMLGTLHPLLGKYAIAPVVIVITALTLSMARAPVFNNLLGFFLGLVTWFAAHPSPSLATLSGLSATIAIGTLAGFLAHAWQKRVNQVQPA